MSNKNNLYILSKVTEGDSFTNDDFAKVSATLSRFDFSKITDNEIKRIQLHLNKPIENPDSSLLNRFSSKLLDKINNEKPDMLNAFTQSGVKENTLLSKTAELIHILHDKELLQRNIKDTEPKVKRGISL